MITASRYHDISCGHRVVGHENKCRYLHGHNYRVTFTCQAAGFTGKDKIGRVIDFGVMKTTLCQWLEDNWDHRMLLWAEDPWFESYFQNPGQLLDEFGITKVPFNPTAENMAEYLFLNVGPEVLPNDIRLVSVIVEETRKCSAEVKI